MLESKELTKKFGAKTAVDGVSLKLSKGHVYAMLGPNGSGKTTWMKMAAGLIKPTSGTVFFDGEPVNVQSHARVAYMSTEPYFYQWMTVKEAGRYYADFFKDFSYDKYLQLLKNTGVEEKAKVRALSTGMMAQLKVALNIARDADVYMLDEPFNGIDLLARDRIKKVILTAAGPDKLLLLSSHLVEEMEQIADTAVFIKQGHLIEVDDLEEMREEKGISMADRYREIYGEGENENA